MPVEALHARFADQRSDFLALLNLWRYLQDKQRELSGSQFRKLCRTEHLHYLRVREWQDVHQQLRRATRSHSASAEAPPADPDRVHTALLSGLLSHVGMKDPDPKDPRRRGEYLGARGARFAIAPGSALFKKSSQWVMVAELVETSRLWGRVAAAIKPEWIEPLAPHLVKRSYSEPHWDAGRGAVMAYEKVTLYGIPIVARRRVNYGRIDPKLARELFLRHALVEGDWETRHEFFHDNRALLAEVEELERKARRRDLVVDDEALFDFYDQRVGADVTSAAHFDRWWKQARRDRPRLLHVTREFLLQHAATAVTEQDFPDEWSYGELRFPLRYRFEPGQPGDGVTVQVPLAALDHAAGAGFDWQVPGLREELATALVRSLPKALRRQLVPVPETVAAALARMPPYQEPLRDALARALREVAGVQVPPDAWDLAKVPERLRMTIQVVDGDQVLAEGKDLAALQEQLAPVARASLAEAASGVERRGLRDWTIGTLPRQVELSRAGHQVVAYPALVDNGDTVDVRVFPTEAEQAHHLPAGTRRLLLLALPSPAPYVSRRLSEDAKLALLASPHGSVRSLLADCAGCAVDALVAEHGGPAWDEAAFAALRERVQAELDRATLGVVTEILPVVTLHHQLAERVPQAPEPARADLQEQLAALVHPGFVTELGWQRLPDLHRWLRAAAHRLDKLPAAPERDRRATETVHRVRQAWEQAALPPAKRDRVRWMIEELRVSLFAQQLGTPYPVSEQRIYRALDRR